MTSSNLLDRITGRSAGGVNHACGFSGCLRLLIPSDRAATSYQLLDLSWRRAFLPLAGTLLFEVFEVVEVGLVSIFWVNNSSRQKFDHPADGAGAASVELPGKRHRGVRPQAM
jgi:hypothetical protein